jgi:Flp pilus assembly protein TadB
MALPGLLFQELARAADLLERCSAGGRDRAMPLSDEERKQLRELEEELAAEDPRLARELESGSLWPRQSRGLLAALAWIAGLVLLIGGIAAQLVVVGIVGFLLMGASVYWALRLFQRRRR